MDERTVTLWRAVKRSLTVLIAGLDEYFGIAKDR